MPQMPHWPIYNGPDYNGTLETPKKILAKLSSPHLALKGIFHIGGTNGKGSTVSFISQILKCAGYTTNVYTSPHLNCCNERILLNGKQITDEGLFYYTEKARNASNALSIENPTIFEALTIVALQAFADNPADFNIIEVGMGGFADATRVFKPHQLAATVTTSIGYDHTKFLGNSLAEIAHNKCYIHQAGVPAIIAPQPQEALQAILAYCAKCSVTPLIKGFGYDLFDIEFEHAPTPHATPSQAGPTASQWFGYCFKAEEPVYLQKPRLQGGHQITNAALAITAIKAHQKTSDIPYSTIEEALLQTNWPARLEKLTAPHVAQALPADSEIWLDGAHNPLGAQALSQWLTSLEEDTTAPRLKNAFIVGKTAGSNHLEFMQAIAPNAHIVLCVISKEEAFPEAPSILQKEAQRANAKSHNAKTIEEALHYIVSTFNNAQPQHKGVRIIICGSLYLAKPAKHAIANFRHAAKRPPTS